MHLPFSKRKGFISCKLSRVYFQGLERVYKKYFNKYYYLKTPRGVKEPCIVGWGCLLTVIAELLKANFIYSFYLKWKLFFSDVAYQINGLCFRLHIFLQVQINIRWKRNRHLTVDLAVSSCVKSCKKKKKKDCAEHI